MDRAGGCLEGTLGLHTPQSAGGLRHRSRRQPDRSDAPRPPRCRGTRARSRGRSANAVRRLSLDLLGLPPTPEDVDAFVHDRRPRCLRAARRPAPGLAPIRRANGHLLARPGPFRGYPGLSQRQPPRHLDVPRLRDPIVQQEYALRRFTIEQLSWRPGPVPDRGDPRASGYNRLLQTTQEGGAQAKEYMAKYAADRVRNVSTVWMGATLGSPSATITSSTRSPLASSTASPRSSPTSRKPSSAPRNPRGFPTSIRRPPSSGWRIAGRRSRRSRTPHPR